MCDMASTALPIGDLDNYRQIIAEDFGTPCPLGQFPTHPAYAPTWGAYQDGWPDSMHHGKYMPSKTVSVDGGVLTIDVHTEAGVPCVAALLPKYSRMTYGRFAIRWRADEFAGEGYKMVWLLWPNSGNNEVDGEIDFAERNLNTKTAGGFLHRPVPMPQGSMSTPLTPPDGWHTTVIEWSPGLVVFLLDDVEVYRDSRGVPHGPMHLVLQVETQMNDGAPIPAPALRGKVQLDWVSIWRYDTTARGPVKTRSVVIDAAATVAGRPLVSADASPDVTAVKWMIDDTEVAYDAAAPFQRPFDSTRFANGVHKLWAKGLAGTWFNTARRTITVHNPWDIVMPDTITGNVPLGLDHPYPWISQVQWAIDGGHMIGNRNTAPWTMTWDSTTVANGAHTIFVKTLGSLDAAGKPQWVNGPPHTIQVAN